VKGQYLEIVWADASSDDRWRTFDDLPKLAKIITRGWCVLEDEDRVVIAASYDEESQLLGEILCLPRGCVISARELAVSYA
jgi:hypothetical protein